MPHKKKKNLRLHAALGNQIVEAMSHDKENHHFFLYFAQPINIY